MRTEGMEEPEEECCRILSSRHDMAVAFRIAHVITSVRPEQDWVYDHSIMEYDRGL